MIVKGKTIVKFFDSLKESPCKYAYSIPQINELLQNEKDEHALNYLKAQKELIHEIYLDQVFNLAKIMKNTTLGLMCLKKIDPHNIEKINEYLEEIKTQLNTIDIQALEKNLKECKEYSEILSKVSVIFGVIALASLLGLVFIGPNALIIISFLTSLIGFLVGINDIHKTQNEIVMYEAGKQAFIYRLDDRDAQFNFKLIDKLFKSIKEKDSNHDIDISAFPPFWV